MQTRGSPQQKAAKFAAEASYFKILKALNGEPKRLALSLNPTLLSRPHAPNPGEKPVEAPAAEEAAV